MNNKSHRQPIPPSALVNWSCMKASLLHLRVLVLYPTGAVYLLYIPPSLLLYPLPFQPPRMRPSPSHILPSLSPATYRTNNSGIPTQAREGNLHTFLPTLTEQHSQTPYLHYLCTFLPTYLLIYLPTPPAILPQPNPYTISQTPPSISSSI